MSAAPPVPPTPPRRSRLRARLPQALKWTQRNFVTEVLLPSLFVKKKGVQEWPVFPKLAAGEIAITWIGHASFLVQLGPLNILIDPIWANWLLVMRRLRRVGFALERLPNIDLVLITHAHFDHLNRRTLRKVAARQPIIVPKGVGDLVHDLGFEQVREMEWWQSWRFRGMELTFTPAKHWGARRVTDRHRGYGGYNIQYRGRSVYHAGDTAEFDGFAEIGSRFKPEIALLPIGAYEPPSFRDVHMNPEQAVEAFQVLGSRLLIPMHYGTYRLSYEPMQEPAERLRVAGAKAGILEKIRFLAEGVPQIV